VPETPTPVVSELLLDWLHGGLVFDHTPLSEIVAELQRFYDVPIELENAALSEYTITGTFRDKPLATVLTSICLTLNLRHSFVDGKYVISK
ncbi:MAG: FecR family protein, partial [bacterium]